MTVRTAMGPDVFDLLFDDARLARLSELAPSPRRGIDEGDISCLLYTSPSPRD